MELAMSPTREQFPLSVKKIYKKTLAVILGCTIFILFAYIGLAQAIKITNGQTSLHLSDVTFLAIVLFLAIVALTYLYQTWYFAFYFYDLTPDYIIIKKNPITPKEITIPYERVQDVYVDQDLLDRFFGLYDVHLSSATVSSGMEAKIDGVEREAADGLRALLLKKVHEKISRKPGTSPSVSA